MHGFVHSGAIVEQDLRSFQMSIMKCKILCNDYMGNAQPLAECSRRYEISSTHPKHARTCRLVRQAQPFR